MPLYEYSAHEKLVGLFIEKRNQKIWFRASDLQGGSNPRFYVGYEATARISELVRDIPAMFENRRDGRFMERRVRYEAINEWWSLLPSTMKVLFEDAGITPNCDII